MHRWVRQLGDVATQVGAVSISAIIGILVLAHLLDSPAATSIDAVPVLGPALRGVRAAVGSIVNTVP